MIVVKAILVGIGSSLFVILVITIADVLRKALLDDRSLYERAWDGDLSWAESVARDHEKTNGDLKHDVDWEAVEEQLADDPDHDELWTAIDHLDSMERTLHDAARMGHDLEVEPMLDDISQVRTKIKESMTPDPPDNRDIYP